MKSQWSGMLLSSLGCCLGSFAFAGQSQPSVVWTRPEASLQWKTVMSENAEVSIDWPQGAVSATLTVTYGCSSATTNLTDRTVEKLPITVGFPADEPSESVLGLSIEYRDEGGASLERRTARLGLVRGVNGRSARCFTSSALPKWQKVKASAVLPVAEDVAVLTIDGNPVLDLDAPGWYLWNRFSSGPHELSKTDSTGTVSVTLVGTGGGLSIILR